METRKHLLMVSLNCAGWNWRMTTEKWGDRLHKVCNYIKENVNSPFIIALQEVQLSGGKYLSVFEEEFPDYYIVLPIGWKNQPHAVVSLMLINKKICRDYNVRDLDNADLNDSLRYNFVHINTSYEGLCFRILNVNVPQTCFTGNEAQWYRESRTQLRSAFEKELIKIANTYRSEPDLNLSCLATLTLLQTLPLLLSLHTLGTVR